MLREFLKEVLRFVLLVIGFTVVVPILSKVKGDIGFALFVFTFSPIFYFLLGYVLAGRTLQGLRLVVVVGEVLIAGLLGELLGAYGPFFGARSWMDLGNVHVVAVHIWKAAVFKIGPALLGVLIAFVGWLLRDFRRRRNLGL